MGRAAEHNRYARSSVAPGPPHDRRNYVGARTASRLRLDGGVDSTIDRLQRVSAERPGTLALGGGLPATELFPRAELARAFLTALARPRVPALQYGWPEGSERLRRWIHQRLAARGADVSVGDIIVTNGGQHALSIASHILLDPTAEVLVDAETYPAALELFRTQGARVATFEARHPAGSRPACGYVMPGVSNPRGTGIAEPRRTELLASKLPLLADEAYTELRFDGTLERPLLADAPDRVWHVGTFSKTLCPGLRVGYLVAPSHLRDRALRIGHDTDLQAGSLAQAVLEEFLERDDFDARLERARRFYARRAERMAAAFRRRFPSFRISAPEGGFCLFLETDQEGDDAVLLATATAHGVSFDPGRLFRPSDASSPIAMRLCYSATRARHFDEAAARLERAWLEYLRIRPTSAAPSAAAEPHIVLAGPPPASA